MVTVVVGLLDPRRERELQRKRDKETERETEIQRNGLTIYRRIDSMGYIHTHVLKSWNSPAGRTLRGHLVQTFHLTHEYTETQRRCDLLEIPQENFQ